MQSNKEKDELIKNLQKEVFSTKNHLPGLCGEETDITIKVF